MDCVACNHDQELEMFAFDFDGGWEWLTALLADWDTVIWGN